MELVQHFEAEDWANLEVPNTKIGSAFEMPALHFGMLALHFGVPALLPYARCQVAAAFRVLKTIVSVLH